MKAILRFTMFVAAAAMTFSACSKDDNPSTGNTPEAPQVTMKVVAGSELANSDQTKTVWNDATKTIEWNATGEALQVFQLQYDGAETPFNPDDAETENYVLDGGLATFNVSLSQPDPQATELLYSAIYPAVNYVDDNTDFTNFTVELPADQTPVAGSFDPNADLLIAKPIIATTQPTELQFQFYRMAAIGRMTLNGITPGEKISSVKFTTSQNIAGRSKVDLTQTQGADNIVKDLNFSLPSKSVTLDMQDAVATGTDEVWFTALPVALADGDTFTVNVTTDKATYTKTLSTSATKTLTFVSGHVLGFTVSNLTRTANVTDEYTLVTDAADLNVGDEIIITNGTSGTVQAISTNQASSNRPATPITLTSDHKIITLTSTIQVITLKEGTQPNTFGFNVGDGYLYTNSSSANNLKTQENLDINASWNISISSSGIATIKTAGSATRNWLRYNPNNGSPLFSCYSSGQNDVYIFSKPATTAPRIKLVQTDLQLNGDDVSTHSVGVTLTHAEPTDLTVTPSANWLTAVYNNGNIDITATENDTNDVRTADVILSARNNATGETATATISVMQVALGDKIATTYTFTIDTDNFKNINGGSGYAAYNGVHSFVATATDNSGKTFNVSLTTQNVMVQSGMLQFQKNGATAMYNTTDLGAINSMNIAATAGTYVVCEGDTVQPTNQVSGSNGLYTFSGDTGFMQITNVTILLKASSITITFTKD